MKHSDIINTLGGGTKVSELLGGEVDREAIYAWAARDFIPWKWRPAIVAVARSQGVRLPKDFLPGVTSETVQ